MKTVIDRENFRVYVVTPSGAEIEVAKTSDFLSGEEANEWVSHIHSREPLHFHKTHSKAEAFSALLAHLGLTENEQIPVDKKTTGLYNKFNVTRTDGSDAPGRKHEGCEYFVLDLTHDPFAIPALRTYADVCAKEYPALSADLLKKVRADRKSKPVNDHVYTPLEIQRAEMAWIGNNWISKEMGDKTWSYEDITTKAEQYIARLMSASTTHADRDIAIAYKEQAWSAYTLWREITMGWIDAKDDVRLLNIICPPCAGTD